MTRGFHPTEFKSKDDGKRIMRDNALSLFPQL
jgi:hypothetical protein